MFVFVKTDVVDMFPPSDIVAEDIASGEQYRVKDIQNKNIRRWIY